jgi:pimeloyl-ACP methyl ester carboxylesterase
MAEGTVAFIETVVGEPTRLLGVSDGSIVALLAAVRRPDLVTRRSWRRWPQPTPSSRS